MPLGMGSSDGLKVAGARRRGGRGGWRVRALAMALSGVLVLAGCGGGSKPSKAAYIKRANAICAAENQQMRKIAERKETLQEAIGAAFQLREQTNDKLQALKLPADSSVPAEVLRLRRRATEAGHAIVNSRPRTPARRAANLKFFVNNEKAARLARAYGLTSCVGFAAS
jgi:hypothetical protein